MIFIKTMHLQLNSMLFLYHFTLYIYIYFFKVTGSIVLIDHWYLIIVWNQSKDGPQCLIALDNVAEGYGHWKDESSAIQVQPQGRFWFPPAKRSGRTPETRVKPRRTDGRSPGEAPADGRTEPGWSPDGRMDGARVKPGRTDGRSPGEAPADGRRSPVEARMEAALFGDLSTGWGVDSGGWWKLIGLDVGFESILSVDSFDFFDFFFAVFWNKFSGGSNIDGKDLLHIRGQLRRSVIGK